MVPFTGALIIIVQQQNAHTSVTRLELTGAHYHKLLFNLQIAMLDFRSSAQMNPNYLTAVNDAINALDQRGDLSKKLNVETRWDRVRSDIQSSLNSGPGSSKTKKAITNLMIFMSDISNISALILDPQIRPYHIIYIITKLIPDANDDLNDLLRITRDNGRISSKAHNLKHFIIASNGIIERFRSDLNYADGIIQQHDTNAKASLITSETGLYNALDLVLALNDKIINKNIGLDDVSSLDKAIHSAQTALSNTYNKYHVELLWSLNQRLSLQQDQQFKILVGLALSFIMAVIIFLYARHNFISQKAVEKALYIQALLDAISRFHAIIEFKPDGTIIHANENFQKLTGYELHALKGKHHDILLHPDDKNEISSDNYWQKLNNGEHISGEYRRLGRDGHTIWIFGLYTPVIDSKGKVTSIVKFALDITERLQTEKKIQAYTTDLEFARLQADSANRMKSDFLATMSHEIRTPMNGIIGMTDLLSGTDLNEHQKKYVRTIMSSAETLMTLLNDILDFSKIEAGKISLEKMPINLADLSNDVLMLMKSGADDKNIGLDLKISPSMAVNVVGDPTRIRQILLNLLSNAIKFTEQGHILVTIEEQAAEQLANNDILIRITVTDTGVGIPIEAQNLLFEKFTQADSSTTRKFGGSGLGLAICKKLVEMMGGSIECKSRYGHGSTFTFTMLLERDTSVTPHKLPSTPIQGPDNLIHLKDKSILLAEDNDINQMYATEILIAYGMHVTHAPDGRKALELATNNVYDLILMDCEMPEMDGLTATRLLREHEQSKGSRRTPIIALTAHAMTGDREKCLAAGMDDYLSKPLRKQQLQNVLLKWVTQNPQ
jgi:PAS domain S-box-containing protein